MDQDTELELIDLGDAKEVTQGPRNAVNTEDLGDFPRMRIE